MINKLKINFESRATAIAIYLLITIIGLSFCTYLSLTLYQLYFKNQSQLYRLLDLKNKVSIEKINYDKIKTANETTYRGGNIEAEENIKDPFKTND